MRHTTPFARARPAPIWYAAIVAAESALSATRLPRDTAARPPRPGCATRVHLLPSGAGGYRGVAIGDESLTDTGYAAMHAGGVRGVRFNFVKHLGGMPDRRVVHHVVERIAPMGWHLVLHLDAADIVELAPLLRELRLPFVIDHMG